MTASYPVQGIRSRGGARRGWRGFEVRGSADSPRAGPVRDASASLSMTTAATPPVHPHPSPLPSRDLCVAPSHTQTPPIHPHPNLPPSRGKGSNNPAPHLPSRLCKGLLKGEGVKHRRDASPPLRSVQHGTPSGVSRGCPAGTTPWGVRGRGPSPSRARRRGLRRRRTARPGCCRAPSR